ncbi:MAG: diaminopimelate epimerase [Chitinivibrionales bacterium]|nr:diaminopimelate epimerase [Chitinivibrionales bacterium]MBD3395143.1 diaminopimelate epimerase [Chitinivibrionales bacterium]
MHFAKMEGTGNDFVVTHTDDPAAVDAWIPRVARLCDRRRGIGADGVIFILPSTNADYRMRIFNSDGSEAEMCGNGIRCVVMYLDKTGLSGKGMLTIETGAGLITTTRLHDQVRVDMGPPVLDAGRIPTTKKSGRVLMESLTAGGRVFRVTAVSMGNPHAVIFVARITDDLVLDYGRELERHAFFPRRANVEFVRIISESEIEMRVYERGCGETLACGTGTCAAVVAGVLNGKLGGKVTVHLLGGDLLVEWDGDASHSVFLTGPARWVYEGDIAAA